MTEVSFVICYRITDLQWGPLDNFWIKLVADQEMTGGSFSPHPPSSVVEIKLSKPPEQDSGDLQVGAQTQAAGGWAPRRGRGHSGSSPTLLYPSCHLTATESHPLS